MDNHKNCSQLELMIIIVACEEGEKVETKSYLERLEKPLLRKKKKKVKKTSSVSATWHCSRCDKLNTNRKICRFSFLKKPHESRGF